VPTLSEAESKQRLGEFGIPFAAEHVVADPASAARAAEELGFPVALKVSGGQIAHKTERGLVRLGLADAEAVEAAGHQLLNMTVPADGDVLLLVAPMISGSRELIAGVSRDAAFGLTVMVGLGGIAAEALGDVSIRRVPISRQDALDMLDDLKLQELLGEFRGEPVVDRGAVADVLTGLSAAAESLRNLVSVDLNPLIICDGQPVAVDALVEVDA
jgi:acetyl-CoA synthetase (ADP-forming)